MKTLTLTPLRTVLNSPYAPALSFCAGITYDSLTLTRIDRLFDNLLLLLYVTLLGMLLIITGRAQLGDTPQPSPQGSRWAPAALLKKTQPYHIPALHFLFGSLFSAYAIVYAKSAALNSSAIFLGIILIVLVLNEFFHNRLSGLTIQTALYALVAFSFFTFFLPVMTGHMNTLIFLIGVGLSMAVIWRVLSLTFRGIVPPSSWKPIITGLPAMGLIVLLTGFYFLNWIPPVPLSLKFAGIYHQVEKINGSYRLTFAKGAWYEFLKKSDEVLTHEGPAYAFVAVFAPVNLETTIYHHWQYRPIVTSQDHEPPPFQTTDRIPINISGGREGGYRSYTVKHHVPEGEWQVIIETGDKRVIGTLHFLVKPEDEGPSPLETLVY